MLIGHAWSVRCSPGGHPHGGLAGSGCPVAGTHGGQIDSTLGTEAAHMLAAHEGQVGHPQGTGLGVGVVVVPFDGAGALGVAVVGAPFAASRAGA